MWRGGEQKWGEMEDANPQTSKGTRKGFTRKGLGVLLGPVSGDRFPGKEGSISVGPGWLGRILQAERDGNVDSRQSKSASSWQVAAASVQSGAACGCFWRGCEAGGVLDPEQPSFEFMSVTENDINLDKINDISPFCE